MPLITNVSNIVTEDYYEREEISASGPKRTQITYMSNTKRSRATFCVDFLIGITLLAAGVIALHVPGGNPAVMYSLLTAGGLYTGATLLAGMRTAKPMLFIKK